jgi:hypothetical protein
MPVKNLLLKVFLYFLITTRFLFGIYFYLWFWLLHRPNELLWLLASLDKMIANFMEKYNDLEVVLLANQFPRIN